MPDPTPIRPRWGRPMWDAMGVDGHARLCPWVRYRVHGSGSLASGSWFRASGSSWSRARAHLLILHHIKSSFLYTKKMPYVHLTVVVLVMSSDSRGLYISYQKVNASLAREI